MSRIGKQLIKIGEKTEVSKTGRIFRVKGPLGELSREFDRHITISIENGIVSLTPTNNDPFTRALWGTYASHIKNMIHGVHTPFEKKLLVEGVGYKVALTGDTLTLNVGFSHPVFIKVPSDLKVSVEKNAISISGISKESVGAFAAIVRSKKKPEPYKGKGIRYDGEIIRRKQGKKSA